MFLNVGINEVLRGFDRRKVNLNASDFRKREGEHAACI
jgi:hypothetical protein